MKQVIRQISPTKQLKGSESVKVIVRCRPFIEREKRNNED